MSRSSVSSIEARRRLLQFGACGAMTNTTALSALLNLKLTSAALATTSVPTSGYKALVCVFLNGAIDGFQVLTPFGATTNDSAFTNYFNSRSGTAAADTGISFRREDPSNPGFPGNGWDTLGNVVGGPGGGVYANGQYGYLQRIANANTKPFGNSAAATNPSFLGLHPRFRYLKEIYNQSHATFICNVGSLISKLYDPANPTTAYNNFLSTSTKKPIGLFSHPDLQRHWQTAFPSSRNQVKGWGGKMADLLTDDAAVAPEKFYSAISTLGANIWQTGGRVRPYAVAGASGTSIGGSTALAGYAPYNPALPDTDPGQNAEFRGFGQSDRMYSKMQTDLVNQTYSDLLEKSILAAKIDARDAADIYQAAIGNVTLPSGPNIRPFDTNGGSLGAQLATVARTIKARSQLGFGAGGRQIFMVQVGGWDHHASLLENQHTMIGGGRNAVDGAGGIDAGLKSFYDFLRAESNGNGGTLFDDVTTFTISDFGRTISYNGSGTDHAWGNNMIVMGGSLAHVGQAPRVYGYYPPITLGPAQSPRLDTSERGTYIPTTSTDEFFAELCMWFGLPYSTLPGQTGVLPNLGTFYAGGSSKPIGFLNY